MNLRQIDGTTNFKLGNERIFSILTMNWTGLRIPNPESSMGPGTADEPNTTNWPGIKDPRIDELCKKYNESFDKAERVKIIREIGEVIVHGVALKPGKPTILGIINEKPIIGIPGYPVSSYIAFEEFAKPLIYKYLGLEKESDDTYEAILSKRLVSSLKNKEIVRVNLGYVNNKLIATPLTRGAGVTMSLVKADGFLEIPRNSEGIDAGSKVDVRIIKPLKEIKNSLVSIGSHDIIMDVIGDMMNLSSGHVGSMGGIMAMKRRESHIAPIHLLDENTGEYNISYIKKYFNNENMALIKGVKRLQGFIVQNGNPKKISSFEDLSRNDISYINRQRGAGTRILLDYNLKKLGIDINSVNGYERELNTHMAVAVSVKSGSSDTGLGVLSAAKAMDLDFIPVGYESYDFLLYKDNLEDIKTKRFISILKSEEFREKIHKFGGYELDNIGDIVYIGG
jgi:putative molybdopterin biosynthesis protein